MNVNVKATAKRWAKANGYKGAQGGWIYNARNKPVTQGWIGFYHDFKARMDADIAAGKFKPSFEKPKKEKANG